MTTFIRTAAALAAIGIATPLAASGFAKPFAAQEAGSEQDEYILAAIRSGVCEDLPVATAAFNPETGAIEVTCSEDVEGFVPLLGSLAVPVIGGLAVILTATSGGGGPADTISQ